MGVNSLWEIAGPSARAVRLEALSKKKLAVDASIWIYQFMKAVRDSEGNSLPLSHIVGFFKRICKLLYFGILPVFVFDGGAPELKRKTINKRRERREGQRENREQTARKLLAIQVQRQVQEGYIPRKRQKVVTKPTVDGNGEEVAYLEDVENVSSGADLVPADKDQLFIKRDEYHLPDVGEIKSHKDDQRVVSNEEYKEYADIGGDFLEGIDIDNAHPGTKEFENLPLESQYMVLWHLRMRSRLRMGYTKEQLQAQFPRGMEFSKFQVMQVQKRNFYTQKLLDVAGYNDKNETTQRIAGAKDREYTLLRSDNGWTLALNNGEDAGTSETPITFDEFGNVVQNSTKDEIRSPKVGKGVNQPHSKESLEIDDDDEEWEDVEVETKGENVDPGERAFIESIYDNYSYFPGKVEYDESEMKIAIEESKNDYLALKKKEAEETKRAMDESVSDYLKTSEKSKARESSEKERLTNLFLFDEPSQETLGGPEIAKKPAPEKLKIIQSFLFSDPETPILHEKNPNKIDTSINTKSEASVQIHDGNNDSENFQLESLDGNYEIPLKDDSDEVQELDGEGEKAEVKTASKPVPEWFNLDVTVTDNLYKGLARETVHRESNDRLRTFDSPIRKKSREYEDDQQAGLISWNEARDYMHHDENSDDSDLEEISEPQNIREKKNQAEDCTETISSELTNVSLKPFAEEDKQNSLDQNPKNIRSVEVLDYDFEEEEEEKLVQQIKEEDEQYEYLKTKVTQPSEPAPARKVNSTETSITLEQLLQEQLQKAKRDAEEVTATMINDVQELLRRFGVPFITAPMEAEAQCAKLMKLGLVDGIITDDSDCFLFGGDRIYKNMFNQKTYVECYFKDRINEELGLNQKKLIELALLLGSDYTEGIKGIGPVMAMEVLAEFGDLKNFKKWFDENTQKISNIDADSKLKKSLLQKVKNGKLFLPKLFPDAVVVEAYVNPEVDDDETEFKWGVPNLDQIRSFLMYNVKWTQGRVDEVLVPLIKDINRKKAEGVQSTLGEFFPQEYIKSKKELNLGKRIKNAASRLKQV